jgi:hypothetical protein
MESNVMDTAMDIHKEGIQCKGYSKGYNVGYIHKEGIKCR